MSAHTKPRSRRPLLVRLAKAGARHPVRTLRLGQREALRRWGIGLGGVLVTGMVLAVAGWVLHILSALGRPPR